MAAADLAVAAPLRPLCIDLDGTLVACDTGVESALAVLRRSPIAWLAAPAWLARGVPAFKRELARRAALDPETLPYREEVLALAREEKARGRRIVLATAADRLIADAVAAHLGLFDEVVASDGERNCKGAAKAAALVERFGERGFDYVGDARPDLAVWSHAYEAVVVGSPSLARRAGALCGAVRALPGTPARGRALVRALRPHQWVKNLLVLVAPLAGHASAPEAWRATALLFLGWCATASAIYLANDLADLEADRRHPRKRRRPFASGALSPVIALVLAPPLAAGGLALGWLAGPPALAALAAYGAVATLYTARLKTVALVDVFALAALYVARVIGGGLAGGRPASPWLLALSGFLFLSLAFVKRCAELRRAGAGRLPRRAYRRHDLPMLAAFGVGAGFTAALVLALYVASDPAGRLYHAPLMLWGTVPLLLFWLCRVWLATWRGTMHHDPIVFALRDPASWVTLALGAACVWAAGARP